jgi:Kdo2-lipid IVA lauroyltransferase/acyltransferase
MMSRLVQRFLFYLFLPFLYLIAILPLWLLYRLADLSFYGVYHIIRYRRKVVATNLRQAFPKATTRTIQRLEKAFYHHFCDLLVEYIKSLTLTPASLARRCIVKNPELWEAYAKSGKNLILATGHQGNWEWAGHAVALQTPYTLAVVYKPLSNPYVDKVVARLRTRFGRQIIPEKKVLRTLIANQRTQQATALLADQSPPSQQQHCTTFLAQPTYVDLGVGKLAHRLNQPLWYIHIIKIKRGYYQIEVEPLCATPAQATPVQLTEWYTACLEKAIYAQPTTWLWSHNRWKRSL